MLVLGRRLDETILIGDSIVIKVVGIEGSQVKLGISAPREVMVMRTELLERTSSYKHHALKEEMEY